MYKVSQVLLLNIAKILVATVVMSVALYISSSLSARLFFDRIFARVIYLAALVVLSIVVYFGTLYLMFMGDFKCTKL